MPEASSGFIRGSAARPLPPRWQRHLRLAIGFTAGQFACIALVSAFTIVEGDRHGPLFRIVLPILLIVIGCAAALSASRAYRPHRPFLTGALAGIACASITLTLIIGAWALQLI